MADFLAMHGYGAYVWPAYAVFVLALATDTIMPLRQRRRALRELQARLRRVAAKKSP